MNEKDGHHPFSRQSMFIHQYTKPMRHRFILFLLFLTVATGIQAQVADAGIDPLAPKVLQWVKHSQADSLLSHCTPQVKAQMPAATLNGLWQQLLQQTGEWKEQGPWQHETKQGLDIYHVILTFARATLQFHVILTPDRQVAGFTLTPVPPSAETPTQGTPIPAHCTERDITVAHGAISLPGTLTLPAHPQGKVPMVVMVQGSGPSDRNESVGPNKPFRDLAWALAEKGIASLRYDKRTFVYGQRTAEVSNGIVNYDSEITEDAVEALSLAARQPETDTHHIYLLGHSLGGTLAPRIAQKSATPISGIIFLAAMARPFWDVVKEQLLYISICSDDATLRQPDWTSTQLKQMKAALPPEYLQMQESYQAIATAQSLPPQQRMLFMQGGHDYQVTEEDFKLWKASLAQSHPQAEFCYFDQLDHLFRPLPEMATPRDYKRPGKISPDAVQAIVRFVLNENK